MLKLEGTCIRKQYRPIYIHSDFPHPVFLSSHHICHSTWKYFTLVWCSLIKPVSLMQQCLLHKILRSIAAGTMLGCTQKWEGLNTHLPPPSGRALGGHSLPSAGFWIKIVFLVVFFFLTARPILCCNNIFSIQEDHSVTLFISVVIR